METNQHDLLQEAHLNELAVPLSILPETSSEALEKLVGAQEWMMQKDQVLIHTDHLLHAGMYARTITMPAKTVLMGVLIKIPTMVITVGSAAVFLDGEWVDVDGYAVLPARANRKQAFVSRGPFVITMLFPTNAKTVEEAEATFTDESDILLSHRQDANTVRITEEA